MKANFQLKTQIQGRGQYLSTFTTKCPNYSPTLFTSQNSPNQNFIFWFWPVFPDLALLCAALTSLFGVTLFPYANLSNFGSLVFCRNLLRTATHSYTRQISRIKHESYNEISATKRCKDTRKFTKRNTHTHTLIITRKSHEDRWRGCLTRLRQLFTIARIANAFLAIYRVRGRYTRAGYYAFRDTPTPRETNGPLSIYANVTIVLDASVACLRSPETHQNRNLRARPS